MNSLNKKDVVNIKYLVCNDTIIYSNLLQQCIKSNVNNILNL
jgi:hypothetical protein